MGTAGAVVVMPVLVDVPLVDDVLDEVEDVLLVEIVVAVVVGPGGGSGRTRVLGDAKRMVSATVVMIKTMVSMTIPDTKILWLKAENNGPLGGRTPPPPPPLLMIGGAFTKI